MGPVNGSDTHVTSNMQSPTNTMPPVSAVDEAKQWLSDMEYLYMRSFNELEAVFRTEFRSSQAFKDMVIELN